MVIYLRCIYILFRFIQDYVKFGLVAFSKIAVYVVIVIVFIGTPFCSSQIIIRSLYKPFFGGPHSFDLRAPIYHCHFNEFYTCDF